MKKYIAILFVLIVMPMSVWAEAYTLTVEGLVCDFCAQGIEKKLGKEFKDQKIKDIKVDLNNKTVTFDADKIDQEKLKELIKSAGYNLKAIDIKQAATETVNMEKK
ncbi:MAG: heavy metal-associated domain-containing protein [Bdellovibrionota bacterium]